MAILYRLGEPRDIPALIIGAIEVSKIFAMANNTEVDEEGIRQFMAGFFESGLAKPLLAFDHNPETNEEKIAGGLFLLKDKMFFVKDAFLRDRGLFVFPEYKGSAAKIAYNLTRWAIDIAAQNNLHYHPQVDTMNKNADALYKKMGAKYLGGSWLFPKGTYQSKTKKF